MSRWNASRMRLRTTSRRAITTSAALVAAAGVVASAMSASASSVKAHAAAVGGFPEGQYPTPRLEGMFDSLQVGSFHVLPQDQLTSKTYFGLRHTDTFFDALLTGSSGKFYLVSNVIKDAPDGSLAALPWLGADVSSDNGLVPDPRYKPWTGAATQTLTPGNAVEYSLSDTAGPEQFGFGERSFNWSTAEGGTHLTGTLAGQGTQWLLPTRDPSGNTDLIFYNQQGYTVEGTYLGEHVKGHVVIETMWGTADYPSTWWVQNRVGHWAFLVNNYADGSSEYGQILCGEYGARGAIIVNNKGQDVVNTTHLTSYAEANGNIVYDLGHGKKWEFVANPKRAFPLIGTTRLGVGYVKNLNARHRLVSGDAVYLTANRMCRAQP
jgi:hypothetical protein